MKHKRITKPWYMSAEDWDDAQRDHEADIEAQRDAEIEEFGDEFDPDWDDPRNLDRR